MNRWDNWDNVHLELAYEHNVDACSGPSGLERLELMWAFFQHRAKIGAIVEVLDPKVCQLLGYARSKTADFSRIT